MKTLWLVLAGLLVGVLAMTLAAFLALRATLAPLPGEWAVPLAWGPVTIRAGVPSLVRLATSPLGGPLLHGRHFKTRYGDVHLAWREGRLHARCAPCTLRPPGLGQDALLLPEVLVDVERFGENISGGLRSGRVQGTWQGRMASGGMRLHMNVQETPIAHAYAQFAAQIPEVGRARIEGTFSLTAELSLPAGTMTVAPRVSAFAVSGLGTEALAAARSSCTRRASRLTADSWLSRAVIAAEDQRFYDHPGYDLVELGAALASNQAVQRAERGGSTLSQQLAKILVTGDERSPVRKLRELLYAVEMEQTLGKARILRLYLENAPWGEGLCGAEAAARHYFDVRAHELTPSQAAWLAAMLHNPGVEAQRWAVNGRIDLERAQWVLMGMRGLTRSRKLALSEKMAGEDWSPYWTEPGRKRRTP